MLGFYKRKFVSLITCIIVVVIAIILDNKGLNNFMLSIINVLTAIIYKPLSTCQGVCYMYYVRYTLNTTIVVTMMYYNYHSWVKTR